MSEPQQPRIVAEGRWSQDEFGDILYTPEHLRPVYPEPEPGQPGPWGAPEARAEGYRIRSDDTWALARRDYLAGETAATVCARYDLKEGTLRHRARHEGWRRGDVADPEPLDLELELAAGLPDLGDMARHALVRMDKAIRAGRSAEAASWLRICRELTESDLRFSILRLQPATPPSAPHRSPPPAPEPAPEPRPEPEPPSIDAADRDLRALAELAREAAALSPDDAAGHAAVEARLDALTARTAAWTISDHSDDSDPVFSAPGSEFGLARSGTP